MLCRGYVNMWVLRIEMRDSNPVQARAEIFLHSADQIPGQLVQVDTFAEFGRYDHFPEPRIAGFLPPLENVSQCDAFGLVAKNGGLVALSDASAGDIAAVRSPLPGNSVR
jgi:hypothetical protein